MNVIQKIGWVVVLTILSTYLDFFTSYLYAQPEEIELCRGKNRSPVRFFHDMHMGEYECLACHHDMQNGENVLDESNLEEGNPAAMCASCHGVDSKTNRTKAFHRQCMGCHDNVDKGPILCGECHIKQRNTPK